MTKSDYVQFDITFNGRDKIINGMDVSNTIGCFSDEVPYLINIDKSIEYKSYNSELKEFLKDILESKI